MTIKDERDGITPHSRLAYDTMDNKKASDQQVGGLHYKDMPIQPTYFTWRNKLDGMQHSIIKYVCRFRDKGGLEDLLKARHYIDLLIEYEYSEESDN